MNPTTEEYNNYLGLFLDDNFTPSEISYLGAQNFNKWSPAFGKNHVPPKYLWGRIVPTLFSLMETRNLLNYGIIVSIAFRSPEYNRLMQPKGVEGSSHTFNCAIDWRGMKGNPIEWGQANREANESLKIPYYGIGVYGWGVHSDTYHATKAGQLKKRFWGKKIK